MPFKALWIANTLTHSRLKASRGRARASCHAFPSELTMSDSHGSRLTMPKNIDPVFSEIPFSKFPNCVARIVLIFSGSVVRIIRCPAIVTSTVYGFVRPLHIRTKASLRQLSADIADRRPRGRGFTEWEPTSIEFKPFFPTNTPRGHAGEEHYDPANWELWPEEDTKSRDKIGQRLEGNRNQLLFEIHMTVALMFLVTENPIIYLSVTTWISWIISKPYCMCDRNVLQDGQRHGCLCKACSEPKWSSCRQVNHVATQDEG
ncbi:hypothetical protein AJ80_04393 [Polytolypa hystricis UAMH7299]|uniref:Uncharacterized protein n=1 Tax=Polytolypa hystricis (strain UAMH7299) TaxID=1447883 RepID=A0A2B7YAT1_POLH7|nr:hypothetical protein AJ80_04393 [Polytolypa hystricis UAMH7299]